MNDWARPRRVGLIGHPVGHSVSPQFQQAAFDHLSLPVHYERWDTTDDALEARVRGLRGEEFLGANVTVPHKQAVISLVDEATPAVRLTGATNCLVKEQGRLVAHNTDVGGFQRALRDEMGYEVRDRSVVVIGAGGAARAVVAALALEGAVSVLVLNRTPERASRLVADLAPSLDIPLEAGALDAQAPARIAGCALIVNCTSVGLAGSASEGESPLPAGSLPPTAAVVDIIANPLMTPLLREAASGNRAVLGGLAMLVHQGALAFELWTGRPAPLQVMMAAARAAMALGPETGACGGEER